MTATKRLFTPAEANRTLPLVRRIVRDILAQAVRLRDAAGDRETLPSLEQSMRACMRELDQVGCSYKDWNFEMGLVDFPAIIDGEPVLLCWRSDEEAVTWYHRLEDGYRGRTRIPDALLEAPTED